MLFSGILLLLFQLSAIRTKVTAMSGCDVSEVRIVVSPYRICPLGAHIDHQVCIVNVCVFMNFWCLLFWVRRVVLNVFIFHLLLQAISNLCHLLWISGFILIASLVWMKDFMILFLNSELWSLLQGGTVSAMTIDKGIILGFVPSSDGQVPLFLNNRNTTWTVATLIVYRSLRMLASLHKWDLNWYWNMLVEIPNCWIYPYIVCIG